jgi:hypothetical protein
MALTEDQRALLGLLLAGDTYERIAEVLGIRPDEVRTRAHEAASALEEEPKPNPSPEAVRERLRVLERGEGPAASPTAAPARAATVRSPRPAALLAAAAGALVILVVVLALALLDGDDDGESQAPPGDEEDVVVVQLRPVGDSDTSGSLTLARIGDRPAVDLDIRGLTPSGRGETYVLWFVGSGDRALPIAFRPVGQDGRIAGRAPIPSAATGLLPSFDTAELTLTGKRAAVEAIQAAARSETLPERVGTPVLRGALRG